MCEMDERGIKGPVGIEGHSRRSVLEFMKKINRWRYLFCNSLVNLKKIPTGPSFLKDYQCTRIYHIC